MILDLACRWRLMAHQAESLKTKNFAAEHQ
jgi:hypothetical protein